MMGELVIGHMFIGGGDRPNTKSVPVGLLGADYEIVDGYYRIKKIYQGLNWNPNLRAPLTEPGVNIKEGDYILEVNGRPLKSSVNIYSLFENTADRQTVLTVSFQPEYQGSDENNRSSRWEVNMDLRNRDWVEKNRKKVDELSKGKAAYVYLPNTADARL